MSNPDSIVLQRLHNIGFRPAAIWDVGASDGCWSRSTHSIFPEAAYVLFEPLAYTFPEYEEGLNATLQAHPAWHLRAEALGRIKGSVEMTLLENRVGSTSLPQNGGLLGCRTVQIPGVTVDGLVDSGELPLPELMKVDTQGGELSILQGASHTLPRMLALLLETWLVKGYGEPTPLFNELIDFLMPFGFRLWDLAGCYRDETDRLISQDMLFLNVRLFRERGVSWINAWDYPAT